jgi:hypothetical protein
MPAQSLFRGTATTAREATAEQEAAQITAQRPQAYKAALDSTTLSPELQHLVTIINNVGGQYSAQDQVNAYAEATNALESLPKTPQQIGEDPFEIIGGVSFAADLHYEKFSQMIQGSAVVAAENDGIQKAHDAIAAGRDFLDTSSREKFFSTLTPMQRKRQPAGADFFFARRVAAALRRLAMRLRAYLIGSSSMNLGSYSSNHSTASSWFGWPGSAMASRVS